jgi:hypothetical protein
VKDHGHNPHPGISMHKIPVQGGMGLVFVIGLMVIFLMGLPQVRWFFLLSITPGLLIGAILCFIHRRRF